MFLTSDFALATTKKSYEDPSGLGIILQCSISSSLGAVSVISVYWPNHLQGDLATSNQLIADLTLWLQAHRPHQTPEDYIWSILRSHIAKSSSISIIDWDFNCTAVDARLNWFYDYNFIRAHSTFPSFSTHYSGHLPKGQLDHVFGNVLPASVGYCVSPVIRCFTDHRPIWAHYPIEVQRIPKTKRLVVPRYQVRKLSSFPKDKLLSINNRISCLVTHRGSTNAGDCLLQTVQVLVRNFVYKLPQVTNTY